jgi:hypothetical protein
MNSEQEHPQRKRAASPNKQIIMRDAAKICKSERENGCTPEEWWEVKGRLFLSFPTAHNAVGYLHEDSY